MELFTSIASEPSLSRQLLWTLFFILIVHAAVYLLCLCLKCVLSQDAVKMQQMRYWTDRLYIAGIALAGLYMLGLLTIWPGLVHLVVALVLDGSRCYKYRRDQEKHDA